MVAINNNAAAGLAGLNPDEAPSRAVNLGDYSELENNFITLLVAQVKNQDPTNPLDSTEFMQQFSAMSQVKTLENMASMAQSNLVLMDNMQTLTAAGLVGQDVTVVSNSVQLGNEPVAGQVNLQHASGRTVLELTAANGAKTRVELGERPAGIARFELDPKALGLPPGRYAVSVETDGGEQPPVELTGQVNTVRVSSEGPVLEVKGLGQVPFYKIIEFARGGTQA